MKHRFLIIVVLLLTGMLPGAYGQKNHTRLAEKRFANHNYHGAARAFQKAFELSEPLAQKRELAFKIGQSYHKMNQFSKAAQWYADAIGEGTVYVEWYLAYADALLRAGKIDEALAAAGQASRLDARSSRASDIANRIQLLKQQQKAANVDLQYATILNSPYFDYSPSWMDNKLVFASTRKQKIRAQLDGRSAQGFSSLFVSAADPSGDYLEPKLFTLPSNNNTGAFAWDEQRQRGFWTRCINRKKQCSVMESAYDREKDRWSRPKMAGFTQKKYHFGHPYVSGDGDWLYFVSDMPGGFGGKDIYKVSMKEDGSWGIPINLGQPVNTAGDEVFPSKAGDSLLFFSSTGHQGYGGLDVLYSFNRGGRYDKVGLAGYPFNSFADDFGLVMKQGKAKGAMVSNKLGNDNIYFFDVYPIRLLLEVEVLDYSTKKPIAGADVRFSMPDEVPYIEPTNTQGQARALVPAYGRGEVLAEAELYVPVSMVYTITDEAIEAGLVKMQLLLRASQFPAAISGLVTERETAAVMPGETITITGPGGMKQETTTNDKGIYRFDGLQGDNIYTIKVAKQGYFAESRTIRLPELSEAGLFNKANGYDADFELLRIQERKEIVINNIYYDFDKANLRESSKLELNKLVSMLRENPGIRVQISAHTDTRGTHNYNNRLSDARARSVTDYLIANGIHPARLLAKGYGKQFPVVPNARSEAEHQANRRTTFQVTGTDYVEPSLPVQTQQTVYEVPGLAYRVQLVASASRRNPDDYFSALKLTVPNIRFFVQEQNGIYRYEAGERPRFIEAEILRNQVRAAGFPDCFIVPYYNGNRISIQEAKQLER